MVHTLTRINSRLESILMKDKLFLFVLSCFLLGCSSKKSASVTNASGKITKVNPTYFTSANNQNTITKVPCTLSDGSKTECYQIVTKSTPVDHQMGPWCPITISDDRAAGGIWLSEGQVYDVDGAFIKDLATFYDDAQWKMYDSSGKIFITNTQEDCENAANPNVGAEYKNFCVECLPSYITTVSRSYLIPVEPVFTPDPVSFMGRGGGGRQVGGNRPPQGDKPAGGDRPERRPRPKRYGNGVPSTRGIALNGVEFSAPAPVNNILDAYTLAPFDDAGGHINVHQGYHYHAATGMSYAVAQNDGHAPLIGYAIDGHGIYARLDVNGNESTDLDDCRGHYDDIRGYHYHVDAAGNNNFINCVHGAYAQQ